MKSKTVSLYTLIFCSPQPIFEEVHFYSSTLIKGSPIYKTAGLFTLNTTQTEVNSSFIRGTFSAVD